MHLPARTANVGNIEVVYLRDADHTPVKYWAKKYKAKLMEERVLRSGGSDLEQIGGSTPMFFNGSRPKYEETHIVQVAPAWVGACHEAAIIRHLLSADNAQDYRKTRLALADAGYPDSVLDTVPEPK